MSKIKLISFQLSGYRTCIKTVLPLHQDLTALIGTNGAGKTNLLNGVLFLKKLGGDRNRTWNRFFSHVNSSTIFEEDLQSKVCVFLAEFSYVKKTIAIKGTIQYGTDERNMDEVLSMKLQLNLKEFSRADEWLDLAPEFLLSSHTPLKLFSGEREREFNYFSPKSFYPKTRQESNLFHSLGEFINGTNYYSASQFSNPSQCPVSFEIGENRTLHKSGAGNSHEQFILDLHKLFKSKDKTYLKYLNLINEAGIGLLQIIDFIEVAIPSSSYKIRSGLKIQTTKKDRMLIVPVFTVDGNKLSPNQLSEGTFKTLALLFYLVTDQSTLLLIEEPEVCVHHGLLKNIIAIIKHESKLKQIIISTHSDYVLDQLKPENVVLVSKEKRNGTIAKSLTKAMSARDFSALKSYLSDSGNLGEYLKQGGLK